MLSSYAHTNCQPIRNPDTWYTGFLILCSYLPFMNYVIMTFLSVYKRNAFYFFNAQGALFSDFAVWVIQSVLAHSEVESTLCNDRTTFTISSLSAVAVYFSTFYLCEQMMQLDQSVRSTIRSFLSLNLIIGYLANIVLACYSQVYLRLSTASEVATGAAIGCLSSMMFTTLLICFVHPNGKKIPGPLIQWVLQLCCVRLDVETHSKQTGSGSCDTS
jgi:hypothetical protein